MSLVGDLETTGLLRPGATELWLQPFITELYICKIDDDCNITDEFETFIKPPVPIPDEVIEITGITNEMVRNSPAFIEIYSDLCEFVRGETEFYAHNCTFEIGMIENELARHDLVTKFPWPQRHLCTVELSEPLKNKRLSLEKLCELAGVHYENGHRAKSDVLMTVECIKWLKKQELA